MGQFKVVVIVHVMMLKDFLYMIYCYCESVSSDTISDQSFYTIEQLWDGRGCVDAENSCCTKVAISVATGCGLDDLDYLG